MLAILLLLAIGITIYVNHKRRKSAQLAAKKGQEIASLNAHISGQEQERSRIAKDLHDRMGGLINSAKMIHHQYAHQGNELGSKVDGLLSDAANAVREVSHDLSSSTLARHGLVKATESFFNTLNSSGKIHAQFDTSGLDQRLPESIERILDFCIRELVNNTLKYAKASQIELQLLKDADGSLLVTYEDDGQGFDPEKIEHGIGLKSIASRIQSLDGNISIDASTGNGVSFTLQIPLVGGKGS